MRRPLESLRRRPLAAYFILAFLIAWTGSVLAVGSKFLRDETLQFADALFMFLPMLAGPSLAGIAMAYFTDGRNGLRELGSRMGRGSFGAGWWAAAVVIPPVLIVTVLWLLRRLVSPDFSPAFFAPGIALGLLAGFFEEIGWTGFALPRLQRKTSALAAALILGILHVVWHLAADFLGASRSRGAYWLPRFLVFCTSMIAIRVILVWIYSHTSSVLSAQILHASSTGFLAVLVPLSLTPKNDTIFYAAYSVVLWIVVGLIVAKFGRDLGARVPSPGIEESGVRSPS